MTRGRGIGRFVSISGDFKRTFAYTFGGPASRRVHLKIAQVNDGSGNMVQQFIHGTQYIDELVMMRAAGRGDLYVHQGESRLCRDERERPATGKAGTTPATGPRVCPQDASTTRATGGANWNVIALTDLGGSVVERSTYTPYGELTVHQGERDQGESVNAKADRDGGERSERELAATGKASRKRASGRRVCPQGVSTTRATGGGTVDATDKGTPGTTCTGTVSGACRILDLDFDGDYDSADATLFDSLPQGLGRHPGRTATGVRQPFGHQGLVWDGEVAGYQNRNRHMLPTGRRFVQRDPIALNESRFSPLSDYQDGLSLYQIVQSNPAGLLDPLGLCSKIWAGFIYYQPASFSYCLQEGLLWEWNCSYQFGTGNCCFECSEVYFSTWKQSRWICLQHDTCRLPHRCMFTEWLTSCVFECVDPCGSN